MKIETSSHSIAEPKLTVGKEFNQDGAFASAEHGLIAVWDGPTFSSSNELGREKENVPSHAHLAVNAARSVLARRAEVSIALSTREQVKQWLKELWYETTAEMANLHHFDVPNVVYCTTASVLKLWGDPYSPWVTWGQTGDSRIYLLRDQALTQLTLDERFFMLPARQEGFPLTEREWFHKVKDVRGDTLRALMRDYQVDDELIERIMKYPDAIANVLSEKYIMDPQTGTIGVTEGDIFIAATDGLECTPESEIAAIMSQPKPLDRRTLELANTAYKNGLYSHCPDDTTVATMELTSDNTTLVMPAK